MLTRHELDELAHTLRERDVLTLYIGAHGLDPATRDVRRLGLLEALRARRTTTNADAMTRETRMALSRALERAFALQHEAPPAGSLVSLCPAGLAPENRSSNLSHDLPSTVSRPAGWVAFITDDGIQYAGSLPVHVPTFSAWYRGPVVAPYYRALKLQRPVAVAIVDGRSARLFRHAWDRLDAVSELPLANYAWDTGERGGVHQRDRTRPGPRTALASEGTERRQAAAARRFSAAIAERLLSIAGSEAWIVLGGTPACTRAVVAALPPALAERIFVTDTLERTSSNTDIIRAAREGASALRAVLRGRIVDTVLGVTGDPRRSACGEDAVRHALGQDAVDTLLLTARVLELAPLVAEELARRSMGQGATIDVLSGRAANRLDAHAAGIGARLRFRVTVPSSPLRT